VKDENGELLADSHNMLNRRNSVRREVLYSILIEFGVPMKLVRVIKI
jgi:hypothetical protein